MIEPIEAIGTVLCVAAVFQVVALLMGGAAALIDWDVCGRARGLQTLKCCARIEAIGLGVLGVMIAFIYGLHLHFLAWN